MAPSQDNARLGIILMVGFCVLAPLSEAFVKTIGAALPLAQVVLARFAAQLLLLRKETWTSRKPWLTPGTVALIILRAILHVIAIAMFFLSLRFLPLADALAIAYVMPFLILLVGWFGGEKLKLVQVGLAVLGFIGTLMVVQPSFANVGWPALLPLGVAVLFTAFLFITRKISPLISPIDLQAVNGIVAVAVIGPFVIWGTMNSHPELAIVQTTPIFGFYLLMVGLLGTAGHLSMTWALRYASPPTVAPVQYLEIPFGALFGFLFFADLPNGLAALGIVVVIAAGLMVLATTPKSPGPTPPPAE